MGRLEKGAEACDTASIPDASLSPSLSHWKESNLCCCMHALWGSAQSHCGLFPSNPSFLCPLAVIQLPSCTELMRSPNFHTLPTYSVKITDDGDLCDPPKSSTTRFTLRGRTAVIGQSALEHLLLQVNATMEVAGIVVTTLAVGDPLIRAIRGLRKLYHASDEAPEILDRLEHDGSTVSLYLTYVGDTIAQDPSEYPESFIRWFEDEKKLLQRSTAQIDDYAKKVQQRLQANPLVSGVKYAFDVTEISRVQEQLMRSISAIGNMRGICRQ